MVTGGGRRHNNLDDRQEIMFDMSETVVSITDHQSYTCTDVTNTAAEINALTGIIIRRKYAMLHVCTRGGTEGLPRPKRCSARPGNAPSTLFVDGSSARASSAQRHGGWAE